ncbi:hypothetical protein V9L05_08755 [Bernardetia sp. Wsw4-3y2]|uniref:hypothetical protein n=1 Tax=Bernardetia sp. Wsw4-3y2 TaxID=3127471 RepID=UPI0030CBB75E
MKTEQIIYKDGKANTSIRTLAEYLPNILLIKAFVLRVAIFALISTYLVSQFLEVSTLLGILVFVIVLILESTFTMFSVVTARFFNAKMNYHGAFFLTVSIIGLAFTILKGVDYVASLKLETKLETTLNGLLFFTSLLAFVCSEAGAFMMFKFPNETKNEQQKQETETNEKQETAETEQKQAVSEEQKEYTYTPKELNRISEKECYDEKGEVYDLTTSKKYFHIYKNRTGENNEKQAFFYNYIIWFLESERNDVTEVNPNEKPEEYFETSITPKQQPKQNGHKINGVKQPSLNF